MSHFNDAIRQKLTIALKIGVVPELKNKCQKFQKVVNKYGDVSMEILWFRSFQIILIIQNLDTIGQNCLISLKIRALNLLINARSFPKVVKQH